jgi:phospholipase/carboxylesterase
MMTRWFKRFGEGQFDLADMAARAKELAGFIAAARERHGFVQAPIALGYSNGANIAAALLMRHPDALSDAILMRAMNGLAPAPGLDLTGKRVLFLSGAHDPLAPEASRALLKSALTQAGASVSETIAAPGHALTMQDALAAKAWL